MTVDGYDYKNLGIFASIKEHETSSGKWGEGLKMLSLVALRKNIKMELRSRDWIATPITQKLILNQGETNETEVEQLIFIVSKKINEKSKILDDGDEYLKNGQEKSSTTFIDPTPELIKEFRNIHEKIIILDKARTPIYNFRSIDLLDFNDGKLFIRDILIPGNHNLRYSYNLRNFNIENRDRNAINPESMKEQLKIFFQSVGNAWQYNPERVISQFLNDAVNYAKREDGKTYLEFETPFTVEDPEYADKWIKVFKQNFGAKTSIRKSSDQDMNAVHRAQHLGLDIITLPDCVFEALSRMRGRDGNTIPTYEKELSNACENIIMVPESDLTEQERRIIEHLYTYNKYLPKENGEDAIKKIKIYSYDSKYFGTRAAGLASKGNTIMINRDTLNSDMVRLGDVFFHESGHAITGANDADKAFRNFFTKLLAEIANQDMPYEETKLQESIDDNGIGEEIKITDVKKIKPSQENESKEGPENGTREE